MWFSANSTTFLTFSCAGWSCCSHCSWPDCQRSWFLRILHPCAVLDSQAGTPILKNQQPIAQPWLWWTATRFERWAESAFVLCVNASIPYALVQMSPCLVFIRAEVDAYFSRVHFLFALWQIWSEAKTVAVVGATTKVCESFVCVFACERYAFYLRLTKCSAHQFQPSNTRTRILWLSQWFGLILQVLVCDFTNPPPTFNTRQESMPVFGVMKFLINEVWLVCIYLGLCVMHSEFGQWPWWTASECPWQPLLTICPVVFVWTSPTPNTRTCKHTHAHANAYKHQILRAQEWTNPTLNNVWQKRNDKSKWCNISHAFVL